jgi:vancomycin resistance protein YoaR
MTTATDAIPAIEAREAARRRLWPRVLIGFVVGFAIGILLLAAGLLAWDASFQGRILLGVHGAGVDLSGLDQEAAVAALAAPSAAYGAGEVVIRTDAADRSIGYGTFGRRLDVGAMVASAMQIGRGGSPLERAAGEIGLAVRGAEVAPRLALDGPALDTRVAAALAVLVRQPIDATIRMAAKGYETTPARDGRTYDVAAAQAAAVEAVTPLDAPAQVVITVPSIAVPPARSDADVARARVGAEQAIADLVVSYGSKTWTLTADTIRGWARFEDAPDGSILLVVDEAKVAKGLSKVAKGVAKSAVSATYLTAKNGRIMGVTPGTDGRKLDTAATASAIAAALTERSLGGSPGPVRAKVTAVAPKLTTDEARKTAPLMTLLGSWQTWFPISERNAYGANIWLPAKAINGTVLLPGQRFEWWSAIGPVTAARGYGMGGIIKSDHTEPTGAIGGGMCSSSTTLFNAALRAGLQMGARSNHKYYIDRYPLGLDATVSKSPGGGVQTMSFTNDTSHPIFIRGIRIGGRSGKGWVRYEIWGTRDGRTVSLSKPSQWNVRQASTVTVPVSTLPHGVRHQTEYPSNGRDVSVTRVVRDANGRVIHRETYTSHYVLWNGRIEVGI